MALARALAVEPQVLLLDEPFGALDARVREELRAWLRRLHDEVHVTTIFVTHDQEEAMEIAEQIVVINEGRDRAVGVAAATSTTSPANEFVMSFVGPVTRVGGRLVRPHDVAGARASRPRATQPGGWSTRLVAARASRCAWSCCRRGRRRSSAQLSRAEAEHARAAPRARSCTCASTRPCPSARPARA